MLPPFHGERMRAYAEVMREATDRSIDSWPVDEPFTLRREMQALTLDVIMRAVFGVEHGARQEELKTRIRAVIDPVGSRAGVLLLALSGGRLGAGASRDFEASRQALDELTTEKELVVVPGATHLFEEPGALEQVAELAARWFARRFR